MEGNRPRLGGNRRWLEGNRRWLEGNRRRLEGNGRRLEGKRQTPPKRPTEQVLEVSPGCQIRIFRRNDFSGSPSSYAARPRDPRETRAQCEAEVLMNSGAVLRLQSYGPGGLEQERRCPRQHRPTVCRCLRGGGGGGSGP